MMLGRMAVHGHTFLSGINYWPARKAMYWWKDFDLTEAAANFQKLRIHLIIRTLRMFSMK